MVLELGGLVVLLNTMFLVQMMMVLEVEGFLWAVVSLQPLFSS